MRITRNAYASIVPVGEPEVPRLHGEKSCRYEDNIKMYFSRVGCKDVG
jgi:hypothetical protein